MRAILLLGVGVAVASALFGTLAWFEVEAAGQTETMGGVYVLPSFASVFLPALALAAAFVLTTMVGATLGGADRTTALMLGVSAGVATMYGVFGTPIYEAALPRIIPAALKASGIVVLAAIALLARSRLLAAGLLFGALGDALLAWSPDTFLYGAFAFLIGHLFYIALFLRTGLGPAALKQPPRALTALALIAAAFFMTSLLVPRDSDMFVPLSIYTGVLTLMALASFTLPAGRWLAMAGAVLFFISDGFVAANMFHPLDDPTLAYWRSFAGWMIYWAGQAAICFGALGLHKR